MNSNNTVYGRLWSFGIRSLHSRECGLYESADLLLGDHLCEKSVVTKWIDANWPHKRKRRLIGYEQLQVLKKRDAKSSEIFQPNLLDNYYPQRSNELEEVCLFDLVKHYERVGVDENGQYAYRRLNKPHLPNHKLFDPDKENERESYFYSLLLLGFLNAGFYSKTKM